MQSLRILMASAVSLPLLAGTAAAQTQMYPGQDVRVNPAGIRSGQVLLYPGGTMARVVPPLREPNGKYGPIHLHMPGAHRAEARVVSAPKKMPAAKPAESQVAASQPADETPAPAPAPKKRRVAVTPPPEAPTAPEPAKTAPSEPAQAASNGAASAFTFGEDESSGSLPPLGPPVRSKPAPKLASVAPPPAATKPDEPAPSSSSENLVKRGVVMFKADATEPVPAASQGISMLAGDLSDALLKGAERVELLAYGGKMGDKSSDARRLSLKRALTIRQLLIDRGVPSDRIDVRAMGGADSGEPNRVDIFVKTG